MSALETKWIGLQAVFPSEAARRLKVSPTHVRRWCASGKLESMRGPHDYRLILAASVERLARERERKAAERGA